MPEAEQNQEPEDGAETQDASFRVDASALGDDEVDFAKALGFGSNGNEAAPVAEEHAASAPEAAAPADTTASEPPATSDSVASAAAADSAFDDQAPSPEAAAKLASVLALDEPDEPAGEREPQETAATEVTAEPMAADSEPAAFDEIQPRPAAEGQQDALAERAEAILTPASATPPPAEAPAPAVAIPPVPPAPMRPQPAAAAAESVARDDDALLALEASLDAARARHAELEAQLARRDEQLVRLGHEFESARTELPELEKLAENLRAEAESTGIERDQLVDQLAATSGQLVQAQRAQEQLEASLRAARGALIPLPEGERALRAEVIGLRGRIEDTTQENVRLASEVASVATELAIATARVEDRQHEIDYHAERAAAIETQMAEKDGQLEEAVARQREGLALASRLQAENNELRSTQGALEETLQARDLEIAARDEHLRVTREGLVTRDRQLVDLKERLDQERRRAEGLEADLERAALDREVLVDKVGRREARIATLTQTFGRIEQAMGQPIAPGAPPRATGHGEGPPPGPASTTRPTTRPATSRARASQAAATPLPRRDAPSAKPPPPRAAPPRSSAPTPTSTPETAAPATPVRAQPIETVPPAPTAPALDEATEPVPREPLPERAPSAAIAPPPPAPVEESESPPPRRLLDPPPRLPGILTTWRDQRVAEWLGSASPTVADFLATRLVGASGAAPPARFQIRSLGGSLPEAEVQLVAALERQGVESIQVDVLDVDEDLAARRRQKIELAGYGERIDVRTGDLLDWNAGADADLVLLADVLYAQDDPGILLDHVSGAVHRGARLGFVGRVGAGPIQLSASTLKRLEELWQLLPDALARSPHGLGHAPFRGDDGGCPASDVDVAQALSRRFAPHALVAFGHLADLVVGPSRGFDLDPENEAAMYLLDSVVAIDESRGLTESLPPRHGVGLFGAEAPEVTETYGAPWPHGGA